MNRTSGNLTVYYDDPFWVGVFERYSDGKLTACKVTFGTEPKDYEIWEFVLRHYYELKFSPAVDDDNDSWENWDVYCQSRGKSGRKNRRYVYQSF